uniref:Cathepsin propeptide inhibitor domain-containing protein n=1 Tax=Oryza meridionalis TaxID=40149 RepID=A0A0E0E6T8_9ORYZ
MRRQPPDATCASRQRRPGAACSSQIRHGGAGSTRGEAGSGRGGAGSAAPTSRSRVVLRGSRPSTRRDGAPSRPSLAAAILAGRTELRRRRGEGEEERVAAAAALGFPRVARAWATRGSRRLECFKVIRVVSYRLPVSGRGSHRNQTTLCCSLVTTLMRKALNFGRSKTPGENTGAMEGTPPLAFADAPPIDNQKSPQRQTGEGIVRHEEPAERSSKVLSGGLELKLLRPGNTMAPALVGYQRYATKIAGEPPCKLTGDHKLVKTSDDDERMMKNSNLTEEALKVRHEEWMNKFNREYKDEAEKAYRFEMFKSTVRFAEKFNAEQVKEHGYCKSILGTTQFADLTLEEFGHWVDGRRDTFGPPKVTKFD